jgi:hypothetical protein
MAKKKVGKKTKLSKTTKNYVRARLNKGTPYEVEVQLIKPVPTGGLSGFGEWLVGLWKKIKNFWVTQIV